MTQARWREQKLSDTIRDWYNLKLDCMALPAASDAFNYAALAKECRTLVQQRSFLVNACIESAFLFERAAHHLGLEVRRVVCQATAMSPLLAQAVADGRGATVNMDEPGYWAVAVGALQSKEDFVGRSEPDKNRFVGHVVCLTEDALIDPSVDQMNRPAKGLILDEPLVCPFDGELTVVSINHHGSVVKYRLHPDVAIPVPKTNKILERLAKGLAEDWASRQAGSRRLARG